MTSEEITERFSIKPPTAEGVKRQAILAAGFREVANFVEATCVDGREKSVAFTHLEEAFGWAVKSVMRNEETR
jgi:hypothetical protein